MARPRNSSASCTITLTTTPAIRQMLEVLRLEGTYGRSVPEVAERLIGQKLNELRGNAGLVERLNKAHLREIEAELESK